MYVTPSDEVGQLRDELRRLRAENERLTRLLDLRGQDTTPAPEQPTAGLAPSGVVTMASPVADRHHPAPPAAGQDLIALHRHHESPARVVSDVEHVQAGGVDDA